MRIRQKLDPNEVKDILSDLESVFAPKAPKQQAAPPSEQAAPHTPPKEKTIPPGPHPAPHTPPKGIILPMDKPGVPQTPTPPSQQPGFGNLTDPSLSPPTQPAPAPAGPVFPPDPELLGVTAKDIRRIAVFYSEECVAEVGAVVGYLQDIGVKVSAHAILITKAMVQSMDPSQNPKAAAGMAQRSEAVAALAVFKNATQQQVKDWEAAIEAVGLRFHCLAPKQIAERATLVDIMTDLLLTDPTEKGAEYRWDSQSDKSGMHRDQR